MLGQFVATKLRVNDVTFPQGSSAGRWDKKFPKKFPKSIKKKKIIIKYSKVAKSKSNLK